MRVPPSVCVCAYDEGLHGRGGARAHMRRQRRQGGPDVVVLAQRARARDTPAQKVHCIYKSFIMNYTMVYLKWEACLVRGYMGYRDYNACGGSGGGREGHGGHKGEGERDPGLQGAPDPRATGRYRVGVSLACARLTCASTRVREWRTQSSYVHTRLQIDIAGCMPAPE